MSRGISRGVSILLGGILFFSVPAEASLPKTTLPPSSITEHLSPLFLGVDPAPFQGILTPYRAGDIPRAIAEVQALQQKGPKSDAEIATYFLGELYLKQAEKGDPEAVSQAMAAYIEAVQSYPESKHLFWGYLQIGKIYARQKLFYEAVGSFKRILEQPHPEEYTWKARLEIARAYRAWGKWLRAESAYKEAFQILPKEKQTDVLFEYADVFYQLGKFEQAYRNYKEAAAASSVYRFQDPHALFQFGDSAYQTHRLKEAKALFLDFYNIHPKAPLATVALLRASALFQTMNRQEEDLLVTPRLSSLPHTFYRLAARSGEKKSEAFHLGRILLSLEALKECDVPSETARPRLSEEALVCNMSLRREAFIRSPQWVAAHIQKIRNHALRLLKENTPSTTAQGLLLEAIRQLQRYRAIHVIAEIEASLLTRLPEASPYRLETQRMLNETLIRDWAHSTDPLTRVTFFHTYSTIFTPKMLREDIGFIIGMSHRDIGLLSKAAEYLEPVAANYKHPLSDEALYEWGQVSMQLGENEQARQAFELYQRRAPDGRFRALADLGEIASRQNRIEDAILLYQTWLGHHVNHPKQGEVYLKLAEVYRFRNDFDSEIKVYQQWMRRDPKVAESLSTKLSDAYFQSGQYANAVSVYQSILEKGKEGKNKVEWIQFRLGQSYTLMGNAEKGGKFFMALAKNGKDPLIRKMAEEHLSASPLPIASSSPLTVEKGRL